MLVFKCQNCGTLFRTKRKRKTCSNDCDYAMRRAAGIKQSRRQPTPDPTPEEIAHKCALIRAGVLVIDPRGGVRE